MKLLLKLRGETLLLRAVKVAASSGADQVVVVLGHEKVQLSAQLEGSNATVVVNPDYALGQSTSLRAALRVLDHECQGIVVIPADQPFVEAWHIRRLLSAAQACDKPIVASQAGSVVGAPVFYHRSAFPELQKITGDLGGRDLLRAHPDWVEIVRFEDRLMMWDVDTPRDYQKAVAESERANRPSPR